MDNQQPLISVITVTYNAAGVLPATMQSLREQQCADFEHIIIDGASTDSTLAVARRYSTPGLRILSEKDNGLYDAMNKGLAEAKGEYVVFLNAGDTFHTPHTLDDLAEVILDNDFPGVVYGQTDIVDASRRRLRARHLTAPANLTYRSFADGMVVCHQAFIALRRITSEYDLRYRFSADYDWCIRVLQHSRRNVLLPEVIIDYLDEGTTTRNRRRSLMERYRIMCYYYGTIPTLLRHVRFLWRALRRRSAD